MNTKIFNIKDLGSFEFVMTSAYTQQEILSRLSGRFMGAVALSERQGYKFDDRRLLAVMLTMPNEDKIYLSEVLMKRNAKVGEPNTHLDIEMFNGKMIEYHKLLAELLKWNLQDFFTYLDGAHGGSKP